MQNGLIHIALIEDDADLAAHAPHPVHRAHALHVVDRVRARDLRREDVVGNMHSMAPDFLASPAAGLGGLEASALPVYGDLVALRIMKSPAAFSPRSMRPAIRSANAGPPPR